jgi:Cytochrome oxidase complex assembly protein 1
MTESEPGSRTNRRIVVIVAGAVLALVLIVVLGAGALFVGIFKVMDKTDSHRCGLAYVQKAAGAIDLLGTPIEQRGFTSGSSKDDNGSLRENITFTVSGPLGEGQVQAVGTRSGRTSLLEVLLTQGGHSENIYRGPLDCSELHATVP